MKSANITRRFPAGWIIIILLFALLFATNPSEGQFTNYLKDRIKEQIEDDETLSGSLQRMIAGPAASIASAGAQREKIISFSLRIRSEYSTRNLSSSEFSTISLK